MRRLFRRALVGVVVAGSAVMLGATPVPAGVGTRLVNGDGDTSGKCLSIENTGRGTRVLMEGCTVNAHQGWEFRTTPIDQGMQIVSQDADARGRCLTAHGEGQQVTMDPCLSYYDSGFRHQVWSRGTGWFQIHNAAPINGRFQCLDVRDNGLSNVVQTWLCGPSNKGNQLWKWY